MTQATRFLLIGGGTVAVGLAIIGVFVPLLPTTPFLLLAAFLYARSSERFYNWLVGNRWIGDYLLRYYERRCMTRRHKVFTLVFLWGVISLSGIFAVDVWWARGLLAGVAIAVTIHLLLLPGERGGS
jgi:uncharacterized membrane protein YbaN (DUF454 family)